MQPTQTPQPNSSYSMPESYKEHVYATLPRDFVQIGILYSGEMSAYEKNLVKWAMEGLNKLNAINTDGDE